MAQFRFVDDNGQIQNIDLKLDEIVLGRGDSCDIKLVDDLISREHARMRRQTDGRWLVVDLGSRNRTYVNGEPIREKLLVAGDVVRIGTKALEFVDDAAAAQVSGGQIDFFVADRSAPDSTAWIKAGSELAFKADKLATLVGVVEVDAFANRPEPIAEHALSLLASRLDADRGFIALCGEDRRHLRLVAARSLMGAGAASFTPVSESFASAGHLQDVAGYYPSQRRGGTPANLAPTAVMAPLRCGGQSMGVIYLDRLSDRRRFDADQAQLLMVAGVQLGTTLGDLHRRLAVARDAESMSRLAVLRRHQGAMNPSEAGESGAMRWQAKVTPGAELCGDLCAIVPVDENRILVAAVDAGGHGTGGMLQAAAMLGALRTAAMTARERMELGRVFGAINAMVVGQRERQPLAAVALWVDLVAGRVSYINAGHVAPMLMTGPTRMVTLDQTQVVLGANAETLYKATAVDLPAAFRLVVVSDGLTESTDKAGQLFGDDKMHEVLLAEEAFGEPAGIIDLLAGALGSHQEKGAQVDDGLILVVAKG